MLIEIKYNIGDHIKWTIKEYLSSVDKETCSFCNGSGKIQGHDKTILYCPKCNGSGKVPKPSYRSGESIISGYQVNYNTERLSEYPNGPKVVYMTNRGYIDQNDIIEES